MPGSTTVPLKGHLRWWVLVPAVAVLLLSIVWARVLIASYHSYREGMAHIENQAVIRAVTYFDRSIHWYTPFNPWVRKSAERLWEIGEKAERDGDDRLALIAYRTIRQGFYAARSVYQPGEDWIERSEERIERLVRADGRDSTPTLPRQVVRDPDVFWSIMVILGLFGWVGSMLGFIMAQWGPWRERKDWPRRRSVWVGGFFAFILLWFAGMCLA